MSIYQKITLFLSSICYILVLYGFLFSEFWLLLLFFILFSICILCFCGFSLSRSELRIECDMLKAETAQKQTEHEQQLSKLQQQITALTDEKDRCYKAMNSAIAERDEALHDKEQAISDKQQLLAQEESSRQQQKETLESFLPPLETTDATKETIDIIAIAKMTIDELKPFAEHAHIKIHISAPEESLLVRADQSRLHIMFRNIIDNSIKYMKRAGQLVVTISNIGDDIFIVLKDNGLGLPANETEHIFELNYQGSNRISGNGLGLTQAKAIVTYYGGTIYAKSTSGNGMGVYVQLPTV